MPKKPHIELEQLIKVVAAATGEALSRWPDELQALDALPLGHAREGFALRLANGQQFNVLICETVEWKPK